MTLIFDFVLFLSEKYTVAKKLRIIANIYGLIFIIISILSLAFEFSDVCNVIRTDGGYFFNKIMSTCSYDLITSRLVSPDPTAHKCNQSTKPLLQGAAPFKICWFVTKKRETRAHSLTLPGESAVCSCDTTWRLTIARHNKTLINYKTC